MVVMAKASPEHSRIKARVHALEQQAESRIVFLDLVPSFLNDCERPSRQEKNPVLGIPALRSLPTLPRSGRFRR
jgi:hypothetical protein